MRTGLYVGRLASMAIVTFSIEAGLISIQIDDDGYVLDTDDLARAGPFCCGCWPKDARSLPR
jgi:hypothetical protein